MLFPRLPSQLGYRLLDGRDGRLTAALDIYRADNVDPRFFQGIPLGGPDLDCPTLGIYLTGDKYIGPAGLENSAKHVNNEFRLEVIENGGHVGQWAKASEVKALLLDFLDPTLR